MGQRYSYLYEAQWITEGSEWRPPEPIILRDAAGATIGNSVMTEMRLTLYDPRPPDYPIIAGVENIDIKGIRGCSLSSVGVFILTLQVTDTIIVDATKAYEPRIALVQYTWSSGMKSDAKEFHIIIKNIQRRPYVAP